MQGRHAIRSLTIILLLIASLLASNAFANDEAATQGNSPRLVVVISIDQFSSELYAEYAPVLDGGIGRLSRGVVYPRAYQSHGNTSTCPGHSTILTGKHPAKTGIVNNRWYDYSVARNDKRIYCAEDERVASPPMEVSSRQLRVETLGDRMKAANPRSRVVALSGKDRAAIMMGGHNLNQRWYWSRGDGFVTDLGKARPNAVKVANALALGQVERGLPPLAASGFCAGKSKRYTVGNTTVGDGRLSVDPGRWGQYESNPALDGATLLLASELVEDMQLGQRGAIDLLALSLSATDAVGHRYGNGGQEMCLQLTALDAALESFFLRLDNAGIDYAVLLTSDHGAMDIPPRLRDRGVSGASYLDPAIARPAVAETVAGEFGLSSDFLQGGDQGDLYIDPAAIAAHGTALRDRIVEIYESHPQVASIMTKGRVSVRPYPTGDPSGWTRRDRARASYHPRRSGDLYVIFQPYVMAIEDPGDSYVAGHGSVYNYDREVPILFWRPGISSHVSDNPAEAVDIMPTLAALVGIDATGAVIDGRCLRAIARGTCP